MDVPTLRALTDVYRIGGRRWFVESLLEELLSVAYQDDLERQTDILAAVFHLDLEGCTEELLGTVLPGMLQVRAKRRRLTDPHGTAVAKVAISCLYGCLLPSRYEMEFWSIRSEWHVWNSFKAQQALPRQRVL